MSNGLVKVCIPRGDEFEGAPETALSSIKNKILNPNERWWNTGGGGLTIEIGKKRMLVQPINVDVRTLWVEMTVSDSKTTTLCLCSFPFEQNPAYFHFNKGTHEIDWDFPECMKVNNILAWKAVGYFLKFSEPDSSLIWETRPLIKLRGEVADQIEEWKRQLKAEGKI